MKANDKTPKITYNNYSNLFLRPFFNLRYSVTPPPPTAYLFYKPPAHVLDSSTVTCICWFWWVLFIKIKRNLQHFKIVMSSSCSTNTSSKIYFFFRNFFMCSLLILCKSETRDAQSIFRKKNVYENRLHIMR